MKPNFSRLLFIVPLLLACALVAPQPTALPRPTQPPTSAPTEAAPTAAAATVTPVAADLTPAELAAVATLSADQGIAVEQITVVSTTAEEWPDGCLGAPEPGELCTEALVPGFRIVLSANGQVYEYRTNQDGSLVRAAPAQPEFTTMRLVVLGADGTAQLVDTGYALLDPGLLTQGLPPFGGAVGAAVYLLNLNNRPEIQRLEGSGVTGLDFGYEPNYALAVWPGNGSEPARLAFGTSPSGDAPQSQLIVANVDGSNVTAVVTENLAEGQAPYHLLAQRWSEDGQALYFSREPYGIGGYIPFSGASSLYRYDRATQAVTELIPFDPTTNFLCLGDLDLGLQRAVGNCADANAVTVYDLSGATAPTTISPPPEAAGYRLLGSARLSPEGGRVAFAMARGEPENEQGWVAVADGLSGAARLVLTGEPGSYYTIAGWLDDSTLLLQQQGLVCDPACPGGLWSLGADGNDLTKIADGQFVAFAGGR
jgi:hypothetical protein